MRRDNDKDNDFYPQKGCSVQGKGNTIFVAFLFIIVGLMFLGKNLGIIDPYIFNIVTSWQMLLIVVGVYNLFVRHFVSAFILIAVGTYFLLPKITGLEGEWFGTYWPVIFIIIGIGLLFKRKNCRTRRDIGRKECRLEEYHSEDGYVVSENVFGSVQQIVLDPVFKGASIKCTFGGTILDLRRTSLSLPETVIDLTCSCGGVEIYLPSDWNVQTQIQAMFGGTEDKRFGISTGLDKEHVLLVRGSVVFGGIVFKS